MQYPQTDLESLMDTTFQRVALFVLLLMATGGGVGIYLGQESTSLSSYASTSGNLVIQFAFSLLYLFFLRLMVGLVFAASGYADLKNPDERSKKIDSPKSLTLFIGVAEVAGGIAIAQ